MISPSASLHLSWLGGFWVSLSIGMLGGSPTPAADLQFNRDIRPILSDHCFACHGPDKNRREGDLRLDTPEGLFGKPDTPGPVVPNQVDQSELIRRIESTDPDQRMPPPQHAKDLSEEQRKLLRAWVEQGAIYQGHWAFLPIRRPDLPKNLGSSSSNPIDLWIDRELASRQLTPAAPENRRALARRLSFDLLGLPPDVDQLESFVQDSSPDALERLVDRWLGSEHFGERMAIWWLDLVRYADSVGYHGDQAMSVSPYRDYVIRSFNDNVPFDRFTLQQIAGDLLPNADDDSMIASGYNRLGMMSAEGGVQDKEYLAKYIAERVRNVSGTWMGITMGCCECHDHKYDPLTSRDFYSMEAFFADIEERGLYAGAHETGVWGPSMKVPSAEQQLQRNALDEQIAKLKSQIEPFSPEVSEEFAQWLSNRPVWNALRPTQATAKNGTTLTIHEDASILASGESPATDAYQLVCHLDQLPITGLRIDVLPDPSLPNRGPGRAANGNFVLSEVKASIVNSFGESIKDLKFASASATYEQTGAANGNPYGKWAVQAAIDDDVKGPTWGWAVMERAGQVNHAVFLLSEPLTLPEGCHLRLTLDQNLDNPQHTLGRFRISFTSSTQDREVPAGVDEPTLLALDSVHSSLSVEQRSLVAKYFQTKSQKLKPILDELARVESARKELEAKIPLTLITKSVKPRMVRVLARGNWMDDQGEEVRPNFPSILPEYHSTKDRLDRADLAQWLVSADHPLTSRVLVNRLWKLFFGYGISRRLDDLGSQGEPPSHPELMDWLAAELMDSGWNLKAMVKRIVMSEAYQRTSNVSPEFAQLDPMNRWLARQNRFRLEAELVRDNALAIGGLLVRQVGGTSVKPYQPPGYWSYLNFPQREWQNGQGNELYRRGLYTHWQRQYLHPALTAFDAPSREECTADRPRSNTPLQSLVLLNDPSYVEAARAFALNAIAVHPEKHDDETRIQWMANRCLSRSLTPDELEVLQNLVRAQKAAFEAKPAEADKLLKVGELALPGSVPPIEAASWTMVARTLLNLHETIIRP